MAKSTIKKCPKTLRTLAKNRPLAVFSESDKQWLCSYETSQRATVKEIRFEHVSGRFSASVNVAHDRYAFVHATIVGGRYWSSDNVNMCERVHFTNDNPCDWLAAIEQKITAHLALIDEGIRSLQLALESTEPTVMD